MTALRTLSVDRTHLFPGARLRAGDDDVAGQTDVVVLFSDGARAEGSLNPTSDGATLEIEAYRTEAGTEIIAKAWELGPDPDGTFRVVRPAVA